MAAHNAETTTRRRLTRLIIPPLVAAGVLAGGAVIGASTASAATDNVCTPGKIIASAAHRFDGFGQLDDPSIPLTSIVDRCVAPTGAPDGSTH